MTVMIIIAILSSAPQLHKCHDPYIGGKYYCTKAFEYIENNAKNGDARCQCFLGNWYYWGENRYWYAEKDLSKAAYWWSESAENEYAPAYTNLGLAYKNGYGVELNFSKAMSLFKLGAEAGNALAMLYYGDCLSDDDNTGWWYDYNEGCFRPIRNIEEAKKWYKEAFRRGATGAYERMQRLK